MNTPQKAPTTIDHAQVDDVQDLKKACEEVGRSDLFEQFAEQVQQLNVPAGPAPDAEVQLIKELAQQYLKVTFIEKQKAELTQGQNEQNQTDIVATKRIQAMQQANFVQLQQQIVQIQHQIESAIETAQNVNLDDAISRIHKNALATLHCFHDSDNEPDYFENTDMPDRSRWQYYATSEGTIYLVRDGKYCGEVAIADLQGKKLKDYRQYLQNEEKEESKQTSLNSSQL